MSKAKQTTLFQSWGTVPSSSPCQQQSRQPSSSKPTKARPKKNGKTVAPPKKQFSGHNQVATKPSCVVDLCNDSDNDAELLAALEESLKYVDQNANTACSSRNTDSVNNQLLVSTRLNTPSECQTVGGRDLAKLNQSTEEYLFPSDMTGTNSTNATVVEDLPGFDPEAGRIWIYPTNYPVREYQLRIVQQALVRNTMVTPVSYTHLTLPTKRIV